MYLTHPLSTFHLFIRLVCSWSWFFGSQVLDALGESIPCVKYDSWMVYVPEGEFLSRIGPTEFFKVYKNHSNIMYTFVTYISSSYALLEIKILCYFNIHQRNCNLNHIFFFSLGFHVYKCYSCFFFFLLSWICINR